MRVAIKSQAAPEVRVWTEAQCQEIHLKSLEILSQTGMQIKNQRALDIFEKGGASVSGDMVYLPAAMVKAALQAAPERIVLCGRGGKRVFLEKNVVNYGLGTDLPFFQDWQTGEHRSSVLQDVIDAAIVTDYLPNMDFCASLGIANDVTTQLADLYHFKAMQMHTEKPLLMTATDGPNLQGLIEMAAAVAGGYEALKARPVFLLYTEPISPLVHSAEALDKLMLASEYSIPVTYASGISNGTTAPITMAGTIALANAECLSGLVLHQLVNPGAPFMYGIVASPADMKTTIVTYGGPETPLYYLAAGAMGHYYNLPVYGLSGCTDSPVLDQQAAIEGMFSILSAALSGTNMVHDNGYLGAGLIGSLEMLVYCDECISFTKHFMCGMEFSADSLARDIDLIEEIGPGGNYVGHETTYKNFSTTNWFPRYLSKKDYQSWEKDDRITMADRIKTEVGKILAQHKVKPLEQRVIDRLDEIIAEHEQRLGKKTGRR